MANKAIKIKTLNAEALKSYIKLEWSNPIGQEKPAITKKAVNYLVTGGQTLAVFGDVLSNEDVLVFKQDVQQLVDTVQTFLPHVRLQRSKWVNF